MAARLSYAQILDYAIHAGFTGSALNTAAAIALAESGGDPEAVGDLDEPSGPSYGLWQINAVHPGAEEAVDPVIGARMAFDISRHGTNFRPWTTFRTGAYKQFLPRGPSEIPSQDPEIEDLRIPPKPVPAPAKAQPSIPAPAVPGEPDSGTKGALAPTSLQVTPPGPTPLHVVAGGGVASLLAVVIQWLGTWPLAPISGDVATAIAGLLVMAPAIIWHFNQKDPPS